MEKLIRIKKYDFKIVAIFSFIILQNLNEITLAQTPAFDWAKGVGGVNLELGASTAVDTTGNLYTVGYFQGTVDFDPGSGSYPLTSAGADDIFVLKLDKDGNFIWAKRIGGSGIDQATSIAVDAFGNSTICGYFNGTVDFDPGSTAMSLTSAGGDDIFILKLDSTGNFIWAKRIGGTATDQANSIGIDSMNWVYLTGFFNGTADFDPGAGTTNLTSAGSTDIFILILFDDGSLWKAKRIGGPDDDRAQSIAVNKSGSFSITGRFSLTVDFNPAPGSATFDLTSAGDNDIFIAVFNSLANFSWAVRMGDVGVDRGYSTAIDLNGNVYSTGFFNGTVDFDPGLGQFNLTAGNFDDIFICKFDNAGSFGWAYSIGSGNPDRGYAITTDANGNVYTSGYFNGTMDFDPGLSVHNLSSSGNDIFISIVDPFGNYLYACKMGGLGDDQGRSITISKSGSFLVTGQFQGLADFNPGLGIFNLNSVGASDAFIEKLHVSSADFVADKTSICMGSNVNFTNLSAGTTAAAIYHWDFGDGDTSNVAGNVSHTYLSSGNYNVSLTVNDIINSTKLVSNYIHVLTPPTVQICLITVDYLSLHNVVYWQKPPGILSIKSFAVYRDTANNHFALIGIVPFDSLSLFKDTASHLYASNGNPNASSWRYKIASIDTCNTISPLSLYHQSIFFQDNNNGNFTWSEYQIEGLGLPVPELNNYKFYRDSISNGTWKLIQTLSASSTAFTDVNYADYPFGRWKVEGIWNSICDPSQRTNTGVNNTRSNIKNRNAIGVKEISFDKYIHILPNPATQFAIIKSEIALANILIIDCFGRVVLNHAVEDSKTGSTSINISKLPAGLYTVVCKGKDFEVRKKLVVE